MTRHGSMRAMWMNASIIASLLLVGCGKLSGAGAGDAGADGAAVSEPTATASAASAAPSASASVTVPTKPVVKKPSVPLAVECRARNEGGLIELSLAWTQNTATGTLSVDGKSRPVIAELYKGLVLVDAVGAASPLTGKVATVTTEGAKTIRLGDYKQPTFDCH